MLQNNQLVINNHWINTEWMHLQHTMCLNEWVNLQYRVNPGTEHGQSRKIDYSKFPFQQSRRIDHVSFCIVCPAIFITKFYGWSSRRVDFFQAPTSFQERIHGGEKIKIKWMKNANYTGRRPPQGFLGRPELKNWKSRARVQPCRRWSRNQTWEHVEFQRREPSSARCCPESPRPSFSAFLLRQKFSITRGK